MGAGWTSWLVAALAGFGAACLVHLAWGTLVRNPGPVPRARRPGVVVILRNQAEAVEGLVGLLWEAVAHEPPPDLIFVDDRSTDGTDRVLERLARRYPGLRSVRLGPKARGSAADLGLFLSRSPVQVVAVCDGREPVLVTGRRVAGLLGPPGRRPEVEGA